jgi:hypothetical protein
VSRAEEEEERNIILSLDTYVVMEYIKSSVDIILNLKFEEIEKRLIEKNTHRESNAGGTKDQFRSTSLRNDDTLISNPSDSARSQTTQPVKDGPPKIYEELLQGLEADIRKHIRIEQ